MRQQADQSNYNGPSAMLGKGGKIEQTATELYEVILVYQPQLRKYVYMIYTHIHTYIHTYIYILCCFYW